jgi:regulator of sigma E protease
MYIVLAILVFGVLIAVHELGHFTAAKSLGVRVNEFAIGMGPSLFKRQKGDTLYSLRALPLGGFCAMEGEDEDTEDPRGFTNQAGWKRFVILVSGSVANFVFGVLVILLVFWGGEFASPTITSFMEGSPYEGEQALMEGDTFYKINGHRIYFTNNVSTYLSRGGSVHDIVVIRDGQKVELRNFTLVKLDYEGQDAPMYGFFFNERESGVLTSMKYSWYSAIDFVREVWMALSGLVAGAVGISDLSGPVGIVSMISEVGESSETAGAALRDIAYFAAFIAINLAVMNLLPLPALDGGRIFFLLLNGLIMLLIRRRIDPKYEGYVHATGLILLLGLMAFVMYNDIARLISA